MGIASGSRLLVHSSCVGSGVPIAAVPRPNRASLFPFNLRRFFLTSSHRSHDGRNRTRKIVILDSPSRATPQDPPIPPPITRSSDAPREFTFPRSSPSLQPLRTRGTRSSDPLRRAGTMPPLDRLVLSARNAQKDFTRLSATFDRIARVSTSGDGARNGDRRRSESLLAGSNEA